MKKMTKTLFVEKQDDLFPNKSLLKYKDVDTPFENTLDFTEEDLVNYLNEETNEETIKTLIKVPEKQSLEDTKAEPEEQTADKSQEISNPDDGTFLNNFKGFNLG